MYTIKEHMRIWLEYITKVRERFKDISSKHKL